ncbi:hypothetical protein ABIA33_000003 [Streptacidiphilus sp. MAP12-16]|uniref:hypothetical protein n=1 Tax=Streptacidiphilus sp. MAP12-16 TaxID=3156300 RepID=UPI0035140FD9
MRAASARFRGGGTASNIAAILLGAAVGAAMFSVTMLAGVGLYIVTGAISGLVAALTLRLYGRSARLTELKITVPQLSELTFVVNNESRQVAWRIYVEVVTRISTQTLADDDGVLREALTSLYGLFATTRDTLKSSRPSVPGKAGQSVEHLAITMLNHVLRPFLAKWHPKLRDFEQQQPGAPESAWPEKQACRSELRRVQSDIAAYALGFANLAGVHEAGAMMGPRSDA